MEHLTDTSWIVTSSDITSGWRCQLLQKLKRSGLGLVSPADDDSSVEGEIIHAGMAHAFLHATTEHQAIWSACAKESDSKKYGLSPDKLETLAQITGRAARAFPVEKWRPVILVTTSGVEVPLVEQRLFVPLDNPADGIAASVEEYMSLWGTRPAFSFKPDAILELRSDPDSLPWGIDHKTKDSIRAPRGVDELSLQAHTYWAALEPHIGPLVGFAHYQILREMPKRPKLNQDGSVSKAACVTDEETLIEVVKESTNPDPDHEEYAARRFIARNRQWQVPFPLPDLPLVRQEALEHLRTGFARKIHLGSDLATGRGTGACNGCEYARWCSERFEGRDPRSLLGQEYRLRGKDYLGRVAPADSVVRSAEPLAEQLNTCLKGQSR